MSIAYHLKIVYRNFINQRPFSFLNLIGLSIGLSIAFITLLCITEHTGYDAHHKNSKNTYRLLSKRALDGENMSPEDEIKILKTLKSNIPEIENLFYYNYSYFDLIKDDTFDENTNNVYEEYRYNREAYASPEIIDILTFNLVNGDFNSFKTDPKTVIISEKYALKYFNSALVTGKTISFKKIGTFTIGAVFKDFPKKSSFSPHLIVPIKNLKPRHSFTKAEDLNVRNYFLLEKKAKPEAIIKKINQVVKPLLEENESVEYKFQALENVHLYSEGITNNFSNMSIKKLTFYIIVGVLVLLISLVNFLLLYTAIAKRRLKELMIRKVNGLSSFGLIKMFLLESIIISVAASIIALLISSFLIPIFNDLTNINLEFSLIQNYAFFSYIIVLVLFVSLVSSGYLYMHIKKYNAIAIFNKNNISQNKIFNNGIVIFQLIIVSVMIVFSMGYYKQLHFMIHADKGYNTDDIIVIYENRLNPNKFNKKRIKEELLRHPLILSVASGYSLPSSGGEGHNMSKNDDGSGEFMVRVNHVDSNYLSMYNIQLKEGEDFTENSNRNDIIVNETAVKKLGLKNPIGEEVSDGVIIGVVKDFHIDRFSETILPLSIIYNPNSKMDLSIKYLKGNRKEVMLAIQKVLDKEFPNNTINLNHYDTHLQTQHVTEKTMLKVVLTLTLSAIFITILGLIGMSLFKTQQKTKEIGIRKVNGATIKEIMLMLNKDFIKWVVIAFIIACPIAYYAMSKWLENFAYKTTLSWWVFALAGLFTLVIALLTVSWQTYRAATRNPVESLRDE